jgi:hypothetical protein
MMAKIRNAGLIISSLLGYLSWGGGNSTFLWEAEWVVISKLLTDPAAVLHPMTLLPMIGQLLLIGTLFQAKPDRLLTYAGIACLGLLLGLMLLVGLWGDIRVALSTLPFWALVTWTVLRLRGDRRNLVEK